MHFGIKRNLLSSISLVKHPLVTFAKEILDGELHFLCGEIYSVNLSNQSDYCKIRDRKKLQIRTISP